MCLREQSPNYERAGRKPSGEAEGWESAKDKGGWTEPKKGGRETGMRANAGSHECFRNMVKQAF